MVFSSDNPQRVAFFPRILRRWIMVCGVVGAAFAASQLMEIPARSALRGYDNTFNYLWLRSAMVDGDWDFRNDIEEANTLPPEYRVSALALPLTPAGRIPNKYGIGWAVVSLPFYLVADGLVAGARTFGGSSLEHDGFNVVYQVCLHLGHVALALLALWLAAQSVGSWIGSKEAARVGVVTVWAASPLFYYQTVNVSMSHGVGFFAVAVLAYAIMRAQARISAPEPSVASSAGWWLLSGAGWGLATVTRFQLVVFGAAALAAVLTDSRRRSVAVKTLGLFAAGALPFLLLQAWAWRCVYGEWLVFSYGAEGERFQWMGPAFYDSLFSSWHGFFYWHPLLLIALGGTISWMARAQSKALGWGVALAASAYLSAAWWCWWFASAFGNRSYDAALLPLMAGMGWLFARLSIRWMSVLWGVAIIAAFWNFYLALLYRTGAISRSEPVTWLEMLTAASRLPDTMQF